MLIDNTVSAVIPCFNSAATISDSIGSIVRQTLPVYEIIVVDDGSSDGSCAIVESMAADDSRIKLVRQTNAGPAEARNKGIETATGTWIAFLDSDDQWLPTRLEKQFKILEHHPDLAWIAGAYFEQRAGEKGLKKSIVDPEMGNEELCLLKSLEQLAGKTTLWTGTMLIRREVLRELGGFDTSLRTVEDSDLWLRIAMIHDTIGFVTQPVAIYTLAQANSLTIASTRGIEVSRFSFYRNVLGLMKNASEVDRQMLHSILKRKITGNYLGLLRSGESGLARDFLERVASRNLPQPPFHLRVLSMVPTPFLKVVLWMIKRIRGRNPASSPA